MRNIRKIFGLCAMSHIEVWWFGMSMSELKQFVDDGWMDFITIMIILATCSATPKILPFVILFGIRCFFHTQLMFLKKSINIFAIWVRIEFGWNLYFFFFCLHFGRSIELQFLLLQRHDSIIEWSAFAVSFFYYYQWGVLPCSFLSILMRQSGVSVRCSIAWEIVNIFAHNI